jgi:hypothetical protein
MGDAPMTLADICDDAVYTPTCANCTSYPLSFRDQPRFCKTVMDTVEFMTPACPKQEERSRPNDLELIYDKLKVNRDRLRSAGRRFTHAFEVAEARKLRIEQDRIDARSDFIAGKCDRYLNYYMDGLVYFIACGQYVKVGFTSQHVRFRLSAMMTGNPFDMKVIGFSPGGYDLENKFHHRLGRFHHRHEWFHLNAESRKIIRQLIDKHGGAVADPPKVERA